MEIIRKEGKITPKERVLTTLALEEADRIPINYYANPGIDRRLKEYFGLNVTDDEGLKEVLGVDFRGIYAPYAGPRLHEEITGIHVDAEWGIRTRWVEHESGGYWDYCDFPLKEAGLDEVEAWPMPSPDDYDYSFILDMCIKFERYAVYVGNAGLGDIINSSGMLRGMEQVLVDLITDNPAGLRLIDRRLEIQLEITRRILEAAKGKVDFLWMGEDLGTQHAPLISLDLYRKHIRPRHQRFVDLAKAYNLPVMIHTCGSSSWAYEDFIDMGINAVDTLQPEAANMSPKFLKEYFGGRLAFHGCISTAGPLATGTPGEVKDTVCKTLEIMMPGGGYCLAPTHLIQDNTPVENVIAMYKAAHEYGWFK